MKIERFRAEHLRQIDLQAAQLESIREFSDPAYGPALAQLPHSFTGTVDGKVIVCAGVQEVWPGRAVCWALVSKDAGRHFIAIHRAVNGFLRQYNVRRVEMVVQAGFDEGCRWAEMLGMQREGLMRGYSPSGGDYYLYARVNHGV